MADGKKLQHGTSPYQSLVCLKPKKSVTSMNYACSYLQFCTNVILLFLGKRK